MTLARLTTPVGFGGGFRFVSFFVFVLEQPEIVAGQRLSNVWGKPR